MIFAILLHFYDRLIANTLHFYELLFVIKLLFQERPPPCPSVIHYVKDRLAERSTRCSLLESEINRSSLFLPHAAFSAQRGCV